MIASQSEQWPLMVDPQNFATRWVKLKESGLVVFTPFDFESRRLEYALVNGQPILLENASEGIDPAFFPLLDEQTLSKGYVQLGDNKLEFPNHFRFYITTPRSQPPFLQHLCLKFAVINFSVTPQGLEKEILSILVRRTDPKRDEHRKKHLKEFYQNQNRLKRTEDLILQQLNSSQGALLDDSTLIDNIEK